MMLELDRVGCCGRRECVLMWEVRKGRKSRGGGAVDFLYSERREGVICY